MDWFLVAVAVVGFLILLVINVYLIVAYQHPDDKNEAYFPKFLILIGFTLAQGSVLLLPLDVANNAAYTGCAYSSSSCGGLNMSLVWEIIYLTILTYVILLIPFAIFYYESDDGLGNAKNSMFCSALKYEIVVLVCSVLTLVLMYTYLGYTEIPVSTYALTVVDNTVGSITAGSWTDTSNPPPFSDLTTTDFENAENALPSTTSTITMLVTFPIYCMALLGFVGWFFFVFFAGVGLASLPVDLICGYVYRPRHMDAIEFAEAQLSVRTRVNELIEIGELLKRERAAKEDSSQGYWARRRGNKADRQTVNKFKQAVYMLENDVEELKLCHENYASYNPLIPIFNLFLGIIAMVLSLLWILQICLFILPSPPLTPFLNDYFEWFDTWFSLFGVISVAVFSFYLECCVVKGCFKFGVRFFFITLHPMKLNGTYMNSFLFNLGLILLCSLPVVQFSTIAFADYARFTNVNQIFGVQIKYLQFFSYFWTTNAFIYAILGMAVLSTAYLMCKPRDLPADPVKLRENLKMNRRR
ncbi:hypothetical protein TrST_g2166 [Triparma strigata]|uniref:LMBR1-like membrane protein n=1 Tax=Triparma strigata TaxID=1606541 RepID=A0A9W7EV87_9STRA|nr:hypothetical protein TrST_g2166 [Triparma strigata]